MEKVHRFARVIAIDAINLRDVIHRQNCFESLKAGDGSTLFQSLTAFKRFGTTDRMDNVKAGIRVTNRLAFGLAAMAVVALLYFFAPDQSVFYPRCLFHSLTGMNCPFCGGLRATHQLLHGNFEAAFALNPLFILALPLFFIFVSVSKIVPATTGKKLFNFVSSRFSIWLFVVVIIIFAVLRNTPAFSWMAP
ncbi:MAG: DUF2752 domain-containing protein [Verrucomicrobiota bacterium]